MASTYYSRDTTDGCGCSGGELTETRTRNLSSGSGAALDVLSSFGLVVSSDPDNPEVTCCRSGIYCCSSDSCLLQEVSYAALLETNATNATSVDSGLVVGSNSVSDSHNVVTASAELVHLDSSLPTPSSFDSNVSTRRFLSVDDATTLTNFQQASSPVVQASAGKLAVSPSELFGGICLCVCVEMFVK